MPEYPPIQGGASLILAWRIKDKDVLIVGGGTVAASRIVSSLQADARVTVVCPSSGLNDEVRFRVDQQQVTWIDRPFAFSDLDGRDMVLTAIDDHSLSREICLECHVRRIPVNVADVPPECDFYFMSSHRDGPLQVSVSTNGQGPRLASIIRKSVAKALPPQAGDTIARVGRLRQRVRAWDPEFDGVERRMGWMSGVCDTWGWEGLARLREVKEGDQEEVVMEKMKQWYERGEVPRVEDIFETEHVKDWKPRIEDQADDQKNNNTESHHAETPLETQTQDRAEDKTQYIENYPKVWTQDPAEDQKTNDTEIQQVDNGPKAQSQDQATPDPDPVSDQQVSPTLVPNPTAHIALVGAGPGTPDLLTLRAHRLLTTADLVVSDRLIPSAILSLVTGELRIASEKTAIRSDSSQDELITWCLSGIRSGRRVVRLKIGDPFVFGRGGEEVQEFRRHGYDPEIVPGISSALSAPMRAGAPVTMRGVADQVIITTGRGTKGVMPDLPAYGKSRTLVVLMAVGRAREMKRLLIEKGYPEDVPCVWVQNAEGPDERCVRATVGTVAEVAEREKIESPAVLVVGWVIGALDQRATVTTEEIT
ncbi:tetrapyrrole methylase [Endogone sp. FLAS-F59071]|nr:tetrapyrrole methylase [Endogone sp. FLAS-F59071]|eukprot:RUS14869.1 tetrapyrrole methylase [Endogone sp. FLAS-F59071]